MMTKNKKMILLTLLAMPLVVEAAMPPKSWLSEYGPRENPIAYGFAGACLASVVLPIGFIMVSDAIYRKRWARESRLHGLLRPAEDGKQSIELHFQRYVDHTVSPSNEIHSGNPLHGQFSVLRYGGSIRSFRSGVRDRMGGWDNVRFVAEGLAKKWQEERDAKGAEVLAEEIKAMGDRLKDSIQSVVWERGPIKEQHREYLERVERVMSSYQYRIEQMPSVVEGYKQAVAQGRLSQDNVENAGKIAWLRQAKWDAMAQLNRLEEEYRPKFAAAV